MKKFTLLIIALFLGFYSAMAQLSPSELAKLTPLQKSIYERQSAEIKAAIKAAQDELFKAEDIIRMGKEMMDDNAKAAGAAHIARGVALQEKAQKVIEEERKKQVLLDQAARESIEKKKKK